MRLAGEFYISGDSKIILLLDLDLDFELEAALLLYEDWDKDFLSNSSSLFSLLFPTFSFPRPPPFLMF
jgi:hypothetical protein